MSAFIRGLAALASAGVCAGVALASPAAAVTASPVLASPVAPVRAAALFDPPPRPWLAGHRGVDLLTTIGAPVRAPGAGVVTFAGRVVNRGTVTVSHGALRSSLEPVDATVAVGDTVNAGDVLGMVATDPGHCAPHTCVHWGVRDGDAYVDPLDLLAGFGPVVLLPDP